VVYSRGQAKRLTCRAAGGDGFLTLQNGRPMPEAKYVNLRTRRDGGIMTITLDRPGGRNAFSTEFYAELRSAIREADVDPAIAGVVIDSAADNFAVGGDLKEMLEYLDGDEPSWDLWKFRDSLPFESIRACRKPTIALVDGICCGGGFATAISCDFILATAHSRFGTPETKVGLIDGLVAPALYGQVPLSIIKYLLFSGALIGAEYARDVGLIFEIVAADNLTPRARALLAQFAANGQDIISDYKRVIRSYEHPVDYESTMRLLYSDRPTQQRVRVFFDD
jgi:enoyl-CoA hydratase/carnithine racemase